ncbi:MAG: transketolase [Candidatus Marinimicrobia bacterium]|nr:transketolase [Candidatus Neomarinimicrobiota bacterium]
MAKTILSNEMAKKAANTIRCLSIDAIEEAQSGHPGMPLGIADSAFMLWHQFMKFNPEAVNWDGRDRFILSAGHGSMLLYALLNLFGFNITKDDLKKFRQLGSKTPGHPEYKLSLGVETTTGPLGQGFATGVGMAIAAKMSAARYNRGKYNLFGNEKIYGIVSDGDIMEGITGEAASLAGHLGLGNIIYIYDSNKITIEGSTDLAFSEDVETRFTGYGWQVLKVNGHVHRAVASAIQSGIEEVDKPTLIIAKTHIGYGSPNKQDNAACHGAPLGNYEVKETKLRLNWPVGSIFYIPNDVKNICDERVKELKEEYLQWETEFKHWESEYPKLAAERKTAMSRDLPQDFEVIISEVLEESHKSTREMGGEVMQKLAELFPGFCGGSADLTPSTKTDLKDFESIKQGNFKGRNIHFGIREHAMGAALNGMALYGGFLPFGSTFLVFSSYMLPAIRMAAMMKLNINYIFTHDSFHVGEDGPTHQPVEQLVCLRAIPNMQVIRPADAMEVAAGWVMAIQNSEGPSALILTRQKINVLDGIEKRSFDLIKKGGYVISDSSEKYPNICIVASGSEVELALEAKRVLRRTYGYTSKVVSMPCVSEFLKQDQEYRESVIPAKKTIVAVVEAGTPMGYQGITWRPMYFIGLNRFGVSGKSEEVAQELGFTPDGIAHEIDRFVGWIEDYEEQLKSNS